MSFDLSPRKPSVCLCPWRWSSNWCLILGLFITMCSWSPSPVVFHLLASCSSLMEWEAIVCENLDAQGFGHGQFKTNWAVFWIFFSTLECCHMSRIETRSSSLLLLCTLKSLSAVFWLELVFTRNFLSNSHGYADWKMPLLHLHWCLK